MTSRTASAAIAGIVFSGHVWAEDARSACPIQGEVVHWIADYCMARIGTDDEIAASDCIGEQLRLGFKSTCDAKRHYKRALCVLAISNRSIRGPIEQCVDDPSFKGSTVRKGGIGG